VKRLGYSTIIGYRAAILFFLAPVWSFSTKDLDLLRKLLRSIRNLEPATPRYAFTWDLSVVLQYIKGLGANELLSLELLSQKLVFVLGIVNVSRVSELANLSYIPLFKLSNAWILRSLRWKKNTKAGQNKKAQVVVPVFQEDPLLCPVLCLEHYLWRTSPWRGGEEENLFLSIKHPFKIISPDTIGRWIRNLLKTSGINTNIFKAHSIRGAAASHAWSKGLPISAILSAADWSSEQVFAKFYRRDLDTEFGLTVLAVK
jgi:integrase